MSENFRRLKPQFKLRKLQGKQLVLIEVIIFILVFKKLIGRSQKGFRIRYWEVNDFLWSEFQGYAYNRYLKKLFIKFLDFGLVLFSLNNIPKPSKNLIWLKDFKQLAECTGIAGALISRKWIIIVNYRVRVTCSGVGNQIIFA